MADSYEAVCPGCSNPYDGTLREVNRKAKGWERWEARVRADERRAVKTEARRRLRAAAKELERNTPGNGEPGEDTWLDGLRAAVGAAMGALR